MTNDREGLAKKLRNLVGDGSLGYEHSEILADFIIAREQEFVQCINTKTDELAIETKRADDLESRLNRANDEKVFHMGQAGGARQRADLAEKEILALRASIAVKDEWIEYHGHQEACDNDPCHCGYKEALSDQAGKEMVEALEWYADKRNYMTDANCDTGEKARKALGR